MPTLGQELHTIADLTARMDPNGKIAAIGEWLSEVNEVCDFLYHKEGNLPEGERTTVRAGLPSVYYRGYNQGVPASKSRVAQVDEGAALIEGKSAVDREVAKSHGDVGEYRLTEANAFFEAMTQTWSNSFFYGNAAFGGFTGIGPRFNDPSSSVQDQLVDGGGAGADMGSVWLIVTGPMGVCGIYPKNTKAGLRHIDVTKATGKADDGVDIGMYWEDADGREFLALVDQFNWHCGLSVKDPRKVGRLHSIDRSLLTKDFSTGADLQDLMVELMNRVDGLTAPGHKAAWVMDRSVKSYLERQVLNSKNSFLTYEEVAGRQFGSGAGTERGAPSSNTPRKQLNFGGIPCLRADALAVNEAAL